MAQVTYKILVEYFKSKNILNQSEIAEALQVNKAQISRLINGIAPLSKSVESNAFFEDLLKPYLCNTDMVKPFYKFLKDQQVLNDEIEDKYRRLVDSSKCNNNEIEDKARNDFLEVIVELAELNRHRVSGKEEDTPEKEVTFASDDYHTVINFIGREQLMEDVSNILDKFGFAIICGMGGLGKTQSALRYAEKSKETGKYKQVQRVYFNKNLKTTLLDISFNGLKDYQNNKQNDEDKRIEIRLDILSKFGKDALLIIDNMDVENLTDDDRQIITKLYEMELCVLITSRNTHLYAKHCLVKINSMSEEEQLKLFITHYCNEKQQEELKEEDLLQCKEIIHMVSGHTMLIELIAKTMKEYSMHPKKMKRVLSEGENFGVEVEKDNDYKQEDIYDTLSTLFNVKTMELHDKKILMKLALTSISGIRLNLFDDCLLEKDSDEANTEHNITRINSLIHLSWILRDTQPLPYNDRISLHPLIASTIIRNMKPSLDEYRTFIECAIKAYNADDEEITHSDRRDICNIIIKAGEMFKNDYGYESINLLLDQIDIIYKSSHFTEAYQQCNLALQICRADEKKFSHQLPKAYSLQADVAVKIAKYSEAIDYYMKAINLWEKEHTPPYEDIAKTYTKLGNVHRKNSDYTKALDNFRKAENRIDVSGIDKPFLKAEIFNNIGIVYINLDNLDKAIENYEKGRVIREELVRVDPQPENKKALAYSYHNIGTYYQRKHEMDKAFEWHKKALPYREEVYPPLHEEMAASYTMIGNDYTELSYLKGENHYEEAYDFIIKGLNIRMNIQGPDHPATAWSYESLGKLYYYQKKYREAQDSFRQCLVIREKSLTSNHAYIGEALVWLGKASIECGELELASECLQKAYDIQGVSKPSAQKETAKIMKNLKKKKVTNRK